MPRFSQLASLVVAVLGMALLAKASSAQAADELLAESEKHSLRVVTLVEGLEHPWGLAFLPDGSMLVTERPGRLRLVRDGKLEPAPLAGVPEVMAVSQGGLLDVALHPDFATNSLVYLSYSARDWRGYATQIARGQLTDGGLQDVEVLFTAEPHDGGGRHFGSRLLFAPDGLLYITAGDRGAPDRAQDLGDYAGKIIRLTDSGTVPTDNPFLGQDGAKPEIFSYGHRNPQGLALNPQSGRIWAVEHGPRGGDEANIIEAGANYGWPVITYGKSYAGFSIGEGSEKAGMAQPATYWVPSISPSGLAFYDGDAFPDWRGDLFVGGLSANRLVRLEIEDGRVVHEERLLAELDERIRDVRQGPDGFLYLLTDHPEGALIRLEPAS